MRQLVQDLRSGALEVVEVPDPIPSGNAVLVRTRASLISAGTEGALVETASKSLVGKARERPDDVRRVLDKLRADGVSATVAAVRARLDDLLAHGYSSAGVVEAVGPDVAELRVGDSVACVGFNVASHAELVAVPEPMCIRMPPELDFESAAFAAVGGIAAHGVRLADVMAGSTVVVLGLGLVGQVAAQLATLAGARVVGVDLDRGRADLAVRLGALAADTAYSDRLRTVVLERTDGHGADAVLVTAGSRSAGLLDQAAEIARDRATVCVVGDVPLEASRRLYYGKELQLRVSRSYGPGRYDPDYEELGRDYPLPYVRWTERRLIRYVLEEAAGGRLRLRELVTHEYPIASAGDAYASLSEPGRLAVILRYPEDAPRLRRAELRPPTHTVEGALRVALIGPGTFARSTLLPALAKDERVALQGVVSRTPARSFGVARRWRGAFAATDPEDALTDSSIDCVVIATPHHAHGDLVARAIEAGKSVFVEKPLAIESEELERLRPLLERGRVVVDFNRDFAHATRAVMAHFADRVEPLAINYRVNAGFVEAASPLRDQAIGGGRLVGEGCHFVELCSCLVGAPLETVAVAPLGKGPHTLAGDNFVLTLAYADGSVATVQYVSAGSPRMPKERFEVLGSGRSAVVDDYRRIVLDGRAVSRRASRDKGHTAILRAAVTFFREGGDPPIPYQRLIETTRATLVARDALRAGDASPLSPTV